MPALSFSPQLVEPTLGKGAVVSPCGLYRFLLWRVWNLDRPRMLFIGINPSTADARVDDATVRRCIGFATREKCGGVELVNLFAFRSTSPLGIPDEPEPAESDAYVRAAVKRCEIVVAAFGDAVRKVRPCLRSRGSAREVFLREAADDEGRDLLCLGRTLDGWPRHPLFVTAEKLLEPWEVPCPS